VSDRSAAAGVRVPLVAVVGGEEARLVGVQVLLERTGLDVLAHPVRHELAPPLRTYTYHNTYTTWVRQM
jgi:hypothetical protein